ncbi:lysophosphatidic acid receptor 1-A-like [Xenopus tropicalis]|uniref:Lysophosphatidic acid receptor 1-A-like n=1 Tax=Xenopus tropicalis TaxID=8364 RepID=A0A8J1J603_XENTR|nr:lysophosphatidic acid receptor 1-A-like [Xenopus tropicalis]
MNNSDIWNPNVVLALGLPQMFINVVSVIFNCAVIVTITLSKQLTHPIFILFCNLAISDLLVSLSGFWISLQFITDPDSTIFGSWEVLFAYVAYTISVLSTIYNLVGIGIERYLTVSGVKRRNCGVSRKEILCAAFIIWVIAIFFGSLPLLGWDCLKKDGNVSTLYRPFCVDYLLFISVPNCVIAFVLPLITYIGIILKIRKQKICMQAHGQLNGTHRAAEMQVARTCIFIWILALISYAPLFGGVIWDVTIASCPEDLRKNAFVFRNLSATMITLNSIGNPIIYTLKLKNLGDSFMFCKCKQSSNQISAETNANI